MYRKHLRMARGEGEAQDAGLMSRFVERVVKLPMVHVAWDYATSTYTHLKESNKLVNFTLTNAEKSVSFVAEQARPVVRRFEKQIQAVDTLACRGLGTLEEKVPLITKPPEEILGKTRKLYSDRFHSRIEGIRNYSNGKVKSVAVYGLQKAVDIFGSHLVHLVVTSAEGALIITEHFLDIILPRVDGEHQNDVRNEDNKEKSVLSHVGHLSTHVGHLSSKIRHRAHKHVTQKVESLQERTLDIMLYPIVLVQTAKESLEAPQNYAKALWESLSKEPSQEDRNGPLMKLTRLGVRQLLTAYDLLRSVLPFPNRETEGTESSSQDSAHSPAAVNAVKDRVLWVVGILRLVPSMILLYTYAFVTWLDSKSSSKDEVDGVLYKENKENHVEQPDGEIQQTQQ